MIRWSSPSRLLTALAVLCLALPAAAVESRQASFAGVGLRVVEVDLAHERLELVWRQAGDAAFGSIEALRQQAAADGRDLLFATNAGIYDHAFRPLGLHVEDGQVLRPLNTARGAPGAGNFSIQPNGVFYVDQDGHAGVVTTDAWREAGIAARLATQSGPMLVVDGAVNPAFDAASQSLKWRSGVCAPAPGRVVFAVSEAPLSFHAFARFFRDRLGCADALYLDGTLSRIWTRQDGYAGAPAFMVKPYAGIFAVFATPQAQPGE